jgi:hypothetical protein
MGSEDYKLFIKTIIEIILNLDKSEFPFINKMLYELPPVHLYSDFIKLSRFEGHMLTPSTLIYNMLKDKIENYIFLNLNLKHLFKIYSSNEADYILRKHQYWSKSQNGECQGRSRKWRSRNETWRRRKERRDTKNLCVYNV